MAFFDSPKNRALWDKELAELRKEKEARAKGTSKHSAANKDNREERISREMAKSSKGNNDIAFEFREEMPMYDGPVRERTSYKQLLAEEAASVRAAREGKTRVVQKEHTNDMSMDQGGMSPRSGSGF